MILTQLHKDNAQGNRERVMALTGYILNPSKDGKEKCVYSRALNFSSHDVANNVFEMAALAAQVEPKARPIDHYVLSFEDADNVRLPDGKIDTDRIDRAVRLVIDDFGMADKQIIYGVHADTDNLHVHICLNRTSQIELNKRGQAKVDKVNNNFTHKACQHACNRLVNEMGFKRNLNDHTVMDEQGHMVTISNERSISNKSFAKEAQNGEMSAQSYAQKYAIPILAEGASWEEIHRRLAEQGMEIVTKGRGASLMVTLANGHKEPVKLSDVRRDLSRNNLEKRLGKLTSQERDTGKQVPIDTKPTDLEINPRQPEASTAVTAKYGIGVTRTYYLVMRSYYDERRASWNEYKVFRQNEIRNFKEYKKKEWQSFYRDKPWKKAGVRYQAQKSLKAAELATKKEIIDNAIRERRTAHDRLYSYKFPDIDTWSKLPVATRPQGEEETHPERPRPIDISNYEWEVHTFQVFFRPKGQDNAQVDFIDSGQKITFTNPGKTSSVLAGLQLAMAKWPTGTIITGNKAFIDTCVLLAADKENGITILNPDLQERIMAERKRLYPHQIPKPQPPREWLEKIETIKATIVTNRAKGKDEYGVDVSTPQIDPNRHVTNLIKRWETAHDRENYQKESLREINHIMENEQWKLGRAVNDRDKWATDLMDIKKKIEENRETALADYGLDITTPGIDLDETVAKAIKAWKDAPFKNIHESTERKKLTALMKQELMPVIEIVEEQKAIKRIAALYDEMCQSLDETLDGIKTDREQRTYHLNSEIPVEVLADDIEAIKENWNDLATDDERTAYMDDAMQYYADLRTNENKEYNRLIKAEKDHEAERNRFRAQAKALVNTFVTNGGDLNLPVLDANGQMTLDENGEPIVEECKKIDDFIDFQTMLWEANGGNKTATGGLIAGMQRRIDELELERQQTRSR